MNFFKKLKTFCINLYNREKKKKNPLLLLTHPIDTVEEMKEKRTGSVFWATVILILYTVSEIIQSVATGFLFNSDKAEDFNLFYVLLRSLFLVILFVVGNWSLCTLLEGEGRMIDIYIYTCYCLPPLIMFKIVDTIFSNVVTSDEYVFVNMLYACALIWFVCLLTYSMKQLHNFTMKKVIVCLLLSVVAMAIIFFLLYLFFVLIQQIYTFILTIYTEIIMRTQV